MTPGLQRIGAQPTPQGDAADLGHDATGEDLATQFGNGETRQRHIAVTGQLAREPLNVDDDAGGKAGCAPASKFLLEAGHAFFKEAVAPFADDLAWHIEPRGNNVVAQALSGQQDDLGADDVSIR